MTINIFQVPHGSNVNVGCCGNGSNGSGGMNSDGGQLPPGGTEGGASYSGQARVIDICANVETIFQDAIAAWINSVQNLGYIPGGAESILPTDVTNFVFDSIDELESELYGPEYTLALKKWIVNRFDDPFPGFGADFSGAFSAARARAMLINYTPLFPLVVAGAPFKHAIEAWAYTADIQALNKRIADSTGTASLTGECAQLQREAGREPYQPPASDDSVVVIESDNYKYTRVLNNTIREGADKNYTLSGENFVAYLLRWRTFGEGGVGTASLFSVEVNHTQGTTAISGSDGSAGTANSISRNVSGENDFGAIAAADVAAYLSDFATATNPTNPSGATFPAAGTFAGTFDAETRMVYNAEYQLWIVTDLQGSAAAAEV